MCEAPGLNHSVHPFTMSTRKSRDISTSVHRQMMEHITKYIPDHPTQDLLQASRWLKGIRNLTKRDTGEA